MALMVFKGGFVGGWLLGKWVLTQSGMVVLAGLASFGNVGGWG